MILPVKGSRLHGFEILSVSDLAEFKAKGVTARHLKTGCRVYHVVTDDADNLFAFAFKTPPADNTGVAHILEHSVLCGSRNFPLKDPFLLLLKGSMNTYMNAFTFPDKTVYPASSQVEKDFYNLFRVYGDAVFFPLLRKEAFLQEGHRREFSSEGALEAVGIVYNEMKGNYSSHDSIAGEWAYRSLFPDSPYSFDSGGEPQAILDLSYEDFVDFHTRFYHPSNCAVFLYGNLPTEKHLKFLDDNFLGSFDQGKTVPEVPLAGRWASPIRLERTYPAGAEEDPHKNSSVTLNWLLFSVTDPFKVLSFEILSEVLLGNAGSPLEKALVESGLGEDLSPATGLETETLELSFSVGLRGTSPAKEKEVEELVLSTLREICRQGIDKEQIEGAVRSVEFRSREIKAGAAFGMRLMRRALRGWLHGEAPERTMEFRRPMEEFKAALASDPRFLEKLIEEHLLANPHRSTLVVVPDAGMEKRTQREIRAKLEEEASALTGEKRKALEEELSAFKAFQEIPDSDEAVRSLPALALSDIPRNLETIPSAPLCIGSEVKGWAHDLYTNGIVYTDIAIDLSEAERGPFMYLPLYAVALSGIGAGGKAYDRFALELSLKTGGFSTAVEAGTALKDGGSDIRRFLFLRLKCLEDLLPESLDLVRDLLLSPDLSDVSRLRDVLQEYRNEIKSSIIPGGHVFAAARAERGLSRAEAIEEGWKGISQYLFAAKQTGKKAVEEMAARFRGFQDVFLSGSSMTFNITCPEPTWPKTASALESFASAFPQYPKKGFADLNARKDEQFSEASVPALEGLVVPSSVGFVATAVPGSPYDTSEHAHESVLAHYLTTGPLWEKIRMKGGAYGAFSHSFGREKMFSFSSYRDPNIVSTLKAYRESLEEVSSRGLDPRSAQDAVIGTTAKDMKPLSPSGKSIVGFKRKLYGIEDEARQRHHLRLLETSGKDIRTAADRLLSRFSEGYSAVIAGKDSLNAAAKAFPGLGDNLLKIPL